MARSYARSASVSPRLCSAAVLIGLAGSAFSARADIITWLAASSGNWSNPARWSNSDVPNSLADVAVIDKAGAPYTVTIDFDVPVEAFTLNASNATVNLSGGRWFYAAAVNPDSYCNIAAGTMNVSGSSTLKCDRTIALTGPSAQINLNNGALEGQELAIYDGLVSVAGNSYIRTAVTSLVKPGATLINVPDSNTLHLDTQARQISGPGVLSLSSTYYGAVLALHGDIANYATIRTTSHANNGIYSVSGDPATLLENYGAIEGSGSLGANTTSIYNDRSGVIAGIYPTPLIVDPGTGGMQNNGTMEARSGGVLTLAAGQYATDDPDYAVIRAGDGSHVYINSGAVVTDMRLSTTGTGHIDLSGCSLHEGSYGGTRMSGLVRITDGNTATLSGFLDVTGGTFSLLATYYGAVISLDGDAFVGGAGLISMSSHFNNIISGAAADAFTLWNSGSTFRGSGRMGFNTIGIFNGVGGSIEAAGGVGLFLDPSDDLGLVNQGRLSALAGGRLYLDGPSFDNTGGEIRAEDGGIVFTRAAQVTGGSLTAAGSGYFSNIVSGSVFTSVTSSAPVHIPDSTYLSFVSSFANTGVLYLDSSYYGSVFNLLAGNVLLTGGGTVALTNHANNIIAASDPSYTLINQDNLITGSGRFGNNSMSAVNHGTIQAVGSVGLVLNPDDTGGLRNDALMEAAPGGRLYLDGPGFDNTGGVIHADDTGIVFLRAAQIKSGTFTATGAGYFYNSGSGSVLTSVTSFAPVTVPDSTTLSIEQTFDNRATLSLASSYYGAALHLPTGNATLTGGGSIILSNHANNFIGGASPAFILTNQDNTITGSGHICANQISLINNATVEASGGVGLIVDPVDSGVFDNNGLLAAAPGGRLYLDGPSFDNSGGTISAEADGIVILRGAGITGGLFSAEGSGYFMCTLSTSTLTGITLAAPLNVTDGITLVLSHGVANNGTLALNASYYGAALCILDSQTFSGSGQVTMTSHNNNIIYGADPSVTLTNAGNTIRGGGRLGNNSLIIINGPSGVIRADVATPMTIDPSDTGGFTNQGLLAVSDSGSMTIADGPFTTSGTVTVDPGRLLVRSSGDWIQTGGLCSANGTIQVNSNYYALQGGVMAGSGKFRTNVINSGGVVSPGNSPGTLTIEGNYTQQDLGELAIEVGGTDAGTFDKLSVLGSATLGGTLRLTNLNQDVGGGDQITILTSTGTLSGIFSHIIQPTTGARWGVAYVGKSVILTAFCGADFDGSGFVDTDDFTAFVLAFEIGGDDADFDGSGFVDTDDFTAFVIAFESGC